MITDHLANSGTRYGDEVHMPCPFCGGKDRFIVFTRENRAWCRKCEWRGDEVSLTMSLYNLSYVQACQKLNIEVTKQIHPIPMPRKPLVKVSTQKEQPHNVKEWQAKAKQLLDRANKVMWDDLLSDGICYQWLRARGIKKLTRKCGYVPTSYHSNWGGLDVWIPEGFLLGWYDHPDQPTYKINIRRMNPTPNENKYHMVKGSINGLYASDYIKFAPVTVLVEGELCALAINQFTNNRVIACATGSTTGGRLQKYIAMLATRKMVLVAYDNDEAGESASDYWLRLLPNSKRLKPTLKDPGDMVKAGLDVWAWILSGLKG
jgi:DNA primase